MHSMEVEMSRQKNVVSEVVSVIKLELGQFATSEQPTIHSIQLGGHNVVTKR